MSEFAARVIAWQSTAGRNDLPWQGTCDAYRVWLSEVMLQQTQVATVIPYFRRFIERFPDVSTLAAASLEEVLTLWSGLGYYSRGRNLHRAAQHVVASGTGAFPCDRTSLEALPGIGRSTAAAIAVFSSGAREAILDGNVKRVLTRHFGVEGVPDGPVMTKLWALAESLLPGVENERYTQGMMDLGATVCTRTRPRCGACPVAATCVAARDGRTAELPTRRVRREVPHRETVMLLVRRSDALLLERRPPAGIWGGLLTPPQFDTLEHAMKACPGRFGFSVAGYVALEPLEHGFTHYSLTIRPVVCDAPLDVAIAAEPSTAWMPIRDALEAAIPSPVRTILRRLLAQEATA